MIETYTRAILITGKDVRGNEYSYSFIRDSKWINHKNWFSFYSECELSDIYIKDEILPKVVKVRFGNIELTRMQWIAMGCPFELSSIEIERIKLPNEHEIKI